MCGIHAIRNSIGAQMPDVAMPDYQELRDLASSDKMRKMMEKWPDKSVLEKNGISAEQLSNILLLWSADRKLHLSLAYVLKSSDTTSADTYVTIPSAADKFADSRTLWLHNDNAAVRFGSGYVPHWSGIQRKPKGYKNPLTPAQITQILQSSLAINAGSHTSSYVNLAAATKATAAGGQTTTTPRDAYRQTFPHGHDMLEVEADQPMSGFHAIITSIQSQQPSINLPSVTELWNMLKHLHVRPLLGTSNPTTLQQTSSMLLGAVLHHWGGYHGLNLQLGVIAASSPTGQRYSLVPVPAQAPLQPMVIWVCTDGESLARWSAAARATESPKKAKKPAEPAVVPPKKKEKRPLSPSAEALGGPAVKKAMHEKTIEEEMSSPLPEIPKGKEKGKGKEKAPDTKPAETIFLKGRPIAASILGLQQSDPGLPAVDSDWVLSDAAAIGEAIDSEDRLMQEAQLLSEQVEDEVEAPDLGFDLTHARGHVHCTSCRHWFTDDTMLKKHKCAGPPHEDQPACNICGEPADDEAAKLALETICPARPPKTLRRQCGQCGGWHANTNVSLAQHISRCPGAPQFEKPVCPTCHIAHRDATALKTHIKNGCPALHPDVSRFFTEMICDKDFEKFLTIEDFWAHNKEVHEQETTLDRPWDCFWCDGNFHNRTDRDKHFNDAHSTEDHTIVPSAFRPTGRTGITKVSRLQKFDYWNEAHENDGFDCDDCGRRFENRVDFHAHEKDCLDWRCRICDLYYDTKMRRDQHERICNACPFCRIKFRGIMGLAERMMHMSACTKRKPDDHWPFNVTELGGAPEDVVATYGGQLLEAFREEDVDVEGLDEDAQAAALRSVLTSSLHEATLRLEMMRLKLADDPLLAPRKKSEKKYHLVAHKKSKEVPIAFDIRELEKPREVRSDELMALIENIMKEIKTLSDKALLDAITSQNPQSSSSWARAIVAEAHRIPWFSQQDHHLLDLGHYVRNARGSIYPSDDPVAYLTEQDALRIHRTSIGEMSPEEQEQAVAQYQEKSSEPNPTLIVVARLSGVRPVHEVLFQHLGNHMVARDYYLTFQGHPQQMPPPGEFRSIVINGRSAAHEIATQPNPHVIPPWRHLIDILTHADQQRPRPPIRIIIRSISGLTCAPRRWQRFLTRWPDLDIQVMFALRTRFMLMIQPLPGQAPITLRAFGPSPLGIWYTRRFLVHELFLTDAVFGDPRTAQDASDVNRFMEEEYNARTNHLTWLDGIRIMFIRGQGRNDFV